LEIILHANELFVVKGVRGWFFIEKRRDEHYLQSGCQPLAEDYLMDKEFESVFGVSRWEWMKKPLWRQEEKKKLGFQKFAKPKKMGPQDSKPKSRPGKTKN